MIACLAARYGWLRSAHARSVGVSVVVAERHNPSQQAAKGSDAIKLKRSELDGFAAHDGEQDCIGRYANRRQVDGCGDGQLDGCCVCRRKHIISDTRPPSRGTSLSRR